MNNINTSSEIWFSYFFPWNEKELKINLKLLSSMEIFVDLISKILEVQNLEIRKRFQIETLKMIFWFKWNIWRVLKTKWKIVLWYKDKNQTKKLDFDFWDEEEIILPIYDNWKIEQLSTSSWNLIVAIMLDIMTLLYKRQELSESLQKSDKIRKNHIDKSIEQKREKLTNEILHRHNILKSLISLWIWNQDMTVTSWENNWRKSNLELTLLRI